MEKNIKILIVEDSKTQAEKLKYFLETNNYKVQHANDGEEALAMLKQNVPDIIISDVVMPKIGGYELCKRIKSDENFKKIPVILITSLSGPEEIFKSLACGADTFVTKPYSEDFIISKVNDIIRSIESREDLITESNFEMVYGNQKYVIGSTRLQIVDLLLSTNENAVLKSRELDETNKELVLTQHKLNKLNENLEEEVKARTQRIEHLNEVLRAIRNVNQLLVKEKDRKILIKKACKNFIKTREFHSAWIAIFDDDGKIIDFAGEGGNIDIVKPDEKFLRDYTPSCFNEAIKTDDIVLIEDMESDCKGCPWLKLHKESESGSMVLNLKYGEKNYGILNISLPARYITDKEEQSLFKEIVEDIAFALYNMELEEKRKQAEEALKKHKDHLEVLVKERTQEIQKLSQAVKQSPSSIIITDRNRKIEYVNPAFTLCTGYTHEEVIGKDSKILETGIVQDSFYINIWRKVLSGKVWQGEFQNTKKNGDLYWESTTISPILNEQNEITNFMSIKEDISVRKQMGKALLEAKKIADNANKAKSDFLANMSHEIRTPMNAIIGLSHLALKTELNNKQSDYLIKIERSAQALLGIINEILDFSKIEAGMLTIENTDFNLEDVLETVTSLITYKAQQKGLEVIFATSPEVPLNLIGDPLRVGQILTNLASNSVKFTEKGEIVFLTELEKILDNKIRLKFSVKDTGIGLTKEQKGKLFKSFTQADSSTTRKFGGTGLGLTICKRLVEMMNGKIWVESEYGKGSTFSFTAEFDKPTKAKLKEFVPSLDLRRMSVLVCDDNETSREFLREALESFSFKVTLSKSGQEAIRILQQAKKKPFELVLMDWEMPKMDGLKASEIILHDKQIKPKPPTIIMITAYGQEKLKKKADELGLAAFLVKPVSYSLLFDTIMGVFGKEGTLKSKKYTKGMKHLDDLPKISGAQILLVEDNDINQQVASELLESVGLMVELADNGKIAVDKVKKSGVPSKYDMILMDLQMPVMDGYESTIAIRKLKDYKTLPIVAMTADAMTGVKEKCLEAGMMDFITKPIDPDEVFAKLLQWITKKDANSFEKSGKKKVQRTDIVIPDIQGINISDALKRVNQNKQLYLNILKKFFTNNQEVCSEIKKNFESKNYETAHRLIHTLKGVSGNIEAEKIHELSKKVEQAVLGRNNSAFGSHIVQMETELKSLFNIMNKKLEFEKKAETTIVDKTKIIAIIKNLEKLLEENDPEAAQLIYELGDAGMKRKDFEILKTSVIRYDFDEAINVLVLIKNNLNK